MYGCSVVHSSCFGEMRYYLASKEMCKPGLGLIFKNIQSPIKLVGISLDLKKKQLSNNEENSIIVIVTGVLFPPSALRGEAQGRGRFCKE